VSSPDTTELFIFEVQGGRSAQSCLLYHP
jgi:hypothetical protein